MDLTRTKSKYPYRLKQYRISKSFVIHSRSSMLKVGSNVNSFCANDEVMRPALLFLRNSTYPGMGPNIRLLHAGLTVVNTRKKPYPKV